MQGVIGRAAWVALVWGVSSICHLGSSPLRAETTVAASKPPTARRVTDRPANLKGQVLVLEYHHVDEKETRWGRSSKNFRKDLERLYKAGFRPVTLHEYVTNRMKLPPGASPVVFTFDDGWESQYRILKGGVVDPHCAVGVWQKFAKTRPDFPLKATFFILPPVPFGQKEHAKQKVATLLRSGSELGIHTMSHTSLAKLTDEQVRAEIGGSIDWLKKWGVEAKTLAMPYGVMPKNPVLLKEFLWRGKRYQLDAAVRVGARPSPGPNSPDLRRYNIPRIQGIDQDYGLTWWLGRVKKGRVVLYVQP